MTPFYQLTGRNAQVAVNESLVNLRVDVQLFVNEQ